MFKINVNSNTSQMNSSQYPALVPKTTKITDEYDISNHILGLGINGKVVQCTRKIDGSKYALKVWQIHHIHQFPVSSNSKLIAYLQVLHDNNKARREVELHWRVSGCRHIVNIGILISTCEIAILDINIQSLLDYFAISWCFRKHLWRYKVLTRCNGMVRNCQILVSEF